MKKRLFCLVLCLVLVLAMIPGAAAADTKGPTHSFVVYHPGDFATVPMNIWAGEINQPIGALPEPVNTTLHEGTFNNMYFLGWYLKSDPDTMLDPSFVLKNETYDLYACWREGVSGEQFVDVPYGSWFSDAANYCYNLGLIKGTGDGCTFSPNMTCTRAMVVSVLYRLAGSPPVYSSGAPFTDVPQKAWYSDAVIWASQNNIVKGDGSGKFLPDGKINREQLATIVSRFADFTGRRDGNAGIMLAGFVDENKISGWARDDVSWAFGTGLITGKNSNGKPYMDPAGIATRAEFAVILLRYLKMTDGSRTFFADDYYSAIVPETWNGNVVCKHMVTSFGDCLVFYAKPLYEKDGSGWLFTLGVSDYNNHDYLGLPKFQFLYCLKDEYSLRANVFLILPTDVQCEYPTSHPYGALYQSMYALRENLLIETPMGWTVSHGVG